MSEGILLKAHYSTDLGLAFHSEASKFVESKFASDFAGTVDLILTSPPYPLVAPKAYGNKIGEEYKSELVYIFSSALPLLKETGSLVVEIGNAWEPGLPEMQTLPVETLIDIKNELNLRLCQMFVWDNPNKIPGPASWVNIKRIRVKDSFTHIWWFSPTAFPKANNRNVLTPYKPGMEKLLSTQKYNRGVRPSGHDVGEGFLMRNEGSIPSSVLSYSNSKESADYKLWCDQGGFPRHPARMPSDLAKFFINLTTEPGDLVFDPFGGSNTTGRAAQDLGRRWMITEMSKDYIDGSKGRFIEELGLNLG